MMKLDVFIPGELVDLCVPTAAFAAESEWYSWFNDFRITRFLDQGVFPNTRQAQVDFFEREMSKRLLLMISSESSCVGVISLSCIDMAKRSAQIAIVMDNAAAGRKAPMLALEAMALVTEHGFVSMGLRRIWAGQHVELAGWQQRLELIGYRLEGCHRESFVKGSKVDNAVAIAALASDFGVLSERRGRLWDSYEEMRRRVKALPKRSFSDQLWAFFDDAFEKYYEEVFSL